MRKQTSTTQQQHLGYRLKALMNPTMAKALISAICGPKTSKPGICGFVFKRNGALEYQVKKGLTTPAYWPTWKRWRASEGKSNHWSFRVSRPWRDPHLKFGLARTTRSEQQDSLEIRDEVPINVILIMPINLEKHPIPRHNRYSHPTIETNPTVSMNETPTGGD